jgi:hypothetical protein
LTTPKQLAKNTEKCAIDSFFKTEYDPAKLDNFHEQFGHNRIGGLWLSATVERLRIISPFLVRFVSSETMPATLCNKLSSGNITNSHWCSPTDH